MSFAIVSPSPNPSLPAWRIPGSKMRERRSAGMPAPVSVTVRTARRPSSRSRTRTSRPAGVKRIALFRTLPTSARRKKCRRPDGARLWRRDIFLPPHAFRPALSRLMAGRKSGIRLARLRCLPMAASNAPPGTADAYTAETQTRCRQGAEAACLLAILLVPPFSALDYVVYRQCFALFLGMRVGCVAIMALILVGLRRPFGHTHPVALGV